MGRFIVLEDASDAARDAAAAELAAGSARVLTGWHRAVQGVRIVCAGHVTDRRDAGAAVLAAVSGADLAVLATAPRDVIDQLCDDLSRLGELDHRVGIAVSDNPLSPGEQALLAHLLAGATLGQAAQALHLSRRTADRRLAGARRTLGVDSTSAAMAAAAKLGVRPLSR